MNMGTLWAEVRVKEGTVSAHADPTLGSDQCLPGQGFLGSESCVSCLSACTKGGRGPGLLVLKSDLGFLQSPSPHVPLPPTPPCSTHHEHCTFHYTAFLYSNQGPVRLWLNKLFFFLRSSLCPPAMGSHPGEARGMAA